MRHIYSITLLVMLALSVCFTIVAVRTAGPANGAQATGAGGK